jgi:uncharacterized Rossmann fold enzyme
MRIVSFYAPRPEHPFFQDYTPFLNLLRLSCERFGHQHLVLTDDASVGVAGDAYVTDLPRSLMKATIAAQYAYLSNPAMANMPTLLTGADCVLASDPAIFARHGDLVVTVDDRFQDCRMNCGAIYISHPAALAPVWKAALERCGDEWGDDQTSVLAALDASELPRVELPCDPFNLAPNHPGDDCRRGVVLHFRGPRKSWMVDYCHHWLDLGEGVTVSALPNMKPEALLEHVRINAARDLPWVEPEEAHRGHAVLIGGGPSLEETIPEIRMRAAGGQAIFALNGTARYLIEKGIWPDYGVILDPRPENADFVVWQPEWLLASQCHPLVFEALKGSRRVRVWHFVMDGMMDVLPRDATLVGGGLTVGLTAMGLAFMMGYRNIHLYGYDSSDRDTEAHAYAQGEDAAERKRVRAWCGGREFTCGIAMYAQAKAFPEWAALLAEQGATITVHGDGLLPTIAHSMMAATMQQEDTAA